MLTFNEERHEYKLNGVIIPSVTQVLEGVGLSDISKIPTDILERSRRFGTFLHKTIEYHCKQTLDLIDLDVSLKSSLDGWINFCKDYKYKMKNVEHRGASETYRFGYTIDQMGKYKDGDILIDIKSGIAQPSHKYQMGGYAIAEGKNIHVGLLYLNPIFPRGYKFILIKNNKREQAVFLSALTIYNIMKEEGLR